MLLPRCKWEGRECHYANFAKTVTDYGLCYTFNSVDAQLTTDKTGKAAVSVPVNGNIYFISDAILENVNTGIHCIPVQQ